MYYNNSRFGPAPSAYYVLDPQNPPLLLAYPIGSLIEPPEALAYEQLLRLLRNDKIVGSTLWRRAALNNPATITRIEDRTHRFPLLVQGTGVTGEVGLAIAGMAFGRNGLATMYTAMVLEQLAFGTINGLYNVLSQPNDEFIELVATEYAGVPV